MLLVWSLSYVIKLSRPRIGLSNLFITGEQLRLLQNTDALDVDAMDAI